VGLINDFLLLARSRCLNAGAEDFIVKPLQSKDVQRLRNCSTAARPSSKGGAAPCEAAAVAKRNNKPPLVLPPSACATSPSGRRANLAGVAMVRRPLTLTLTLTLTATPVPSDG
jgi:two-component response regulator (ARR-A family)